MSCKSRHLDAMQTVGNDVHILDWPYVDIGEDTVNPLRDVRVLEALKKVNMEHCCINRGRLISSAKRDACPGIWLRTPWDSFLFHKK